MNQQKSYLILDIGGTKMLSILVTENRDILYRERWFTGEAGNDEASFISQINDAISRAAQQISDEYIFAGVGICIAAFMNYKDGIITGAPNLPIRNGFPLKDTLNRIWDIPVIIENDANAAVLGEVKYGVAKNSKDTIYLTVSTGIGCGLYLDGRIYRGSEGFAGEIGHWKNFGDYPCGCGKIGCLESVASASAVARLGNNILREENGGHETDTAGIFAYARQGHTGAAKVVDTALESLGLSFANLISLLNPSCIVVGGGMSKQGEYFFQEIREYTQKYVSTSAGRNINIIKAGLDPDSGVWGMFYMLTSKNAFGDD